MLRDVERRHRTKCSELNSIHADKDIAHNRRCSGAGAGRGAMHAASKKEYDVIYGERRVIRQYVRRVIFVFWPSVHVQMAPTSFLPSLFSSLRRGNIQEINIHCIAFQRAWASFLRRPAFLASSSRGPRTRPMSTVRHCSSCGPTRRSLAKTADWKPCCQG